MSLPKWLFPALRRWEMRLLVAVPLLFVLVALTLSFLGIELTLRILAPAPLTPEVSLSLQKVRLGLIGLGSAGALGLGLLLAIAIAQPLRRMAQLTRTRVGPERRASHAPANELAELSNALDHMLLSFDKFVTDSNILDAMPEGVLVVDGQGRITRTNAEGRRLLQPPGYRLEGSELSRLSPPEIGRTLTQAVRRVRETGAAVQLPAVPGIEPLGTGSDLLVMVVPFAGGEPGEVLVTVKDLSQLEKIRDEIRRVDQLAAVGAHEASLAHEVCGALMAVQTLLDLLPIPPGEADLIKTKLQAEVERVSRLMNEIRAFGQTTLRERTPCKLGELAEEALWLIQARFSGKHIEIIDKIASHLPVVMGDRDRLTQTIMNVLINAFEATSPDGTISLVAEQDGAAVTLRVANTGSYISPEDQKKIFTPFYTTKKRGTGLGLSLVRRAVMDHGGEIGVVSSVEAGTEFILRFPYT